MAITNFAHMKPWEDMYEKTSFLEDIILDIKNKESCLQVLINARGAIDILLQRLVEANGITDEQILQVKKDKGKTRGGVDLFGRILTLEEYGLISKNSARNLHTIRENGNPTTHGSTEFRAKSLEELIKIAENTYSLLYRETYLFANQYIPEAKSRKSTRVTTGTNSSGKAAVSGGDRKVASGPSATDIILAAVKIFFVLLVTAIMIAMIMNFPF